MRYGMIRYEGKESACFFVEMITAVTADDFCIGICYEGRKQIREFWRE